MCMVGKCLAFLVGRLCCRPFTEDRPARDQVLHRDDGKGRVCWVRKACEGRP
jgi:hypothetical protein